MNRISTYIRQSLQELYPPQELKSLTMMIYCDLLGCEAIDVYLGKDIHLSESKQQELENILSRMKKSEPVQYVRGTASFCGMSFAVNPDVLIPRPETEELVELILQENPAPSRILDAGTGSGCIAIALARHLPEATIKGWDISPEALAVARLNNERLNTNVSFEQQDLLCYQPTSEEVFDLIVSNPPYVTESEKQGMETHVLDWEPSLALFVPDEDPLRFYRCMARLGKQLLSPKGKLYFEINRAYGTATVGMLENTGYHHIRLLKDQFGNSRIITATL